MNIIAPILAFTSGFLFITCKLLSPVKIETLYELGYVSMGKWSIYLISFIAIVCNDGFCMIYFIVFGDVAASFSQQLFFNGQSNIMTTRQFWIIGLAIAMLPIIFKKALAEIKIISYMLFGAVIVFILFLGY